MKKILYMSKELFYLVKKHKVYFLTPIFMILAILAILAFYIGPSVIISFFYAGV